MWKEITLAAVLFQVFRNMYSKKLSRDFKPAIVSLSRFFPGIPLVIIVFVFLLFSGHTVRITSPFFFMWAILMGGCQITANMLLVMLFKRKNFALSITLIKSETLIVAVLGIFIVGENVVCREWAGMGIATLGLMAATVSGEVLSLASIRRSLVSRTALMALAAGTCLALSTISVKKCYGYLSSDSKTLSAVFSLLIILLIQSLFLFLSVLKNDRASLGRILIKPALPIVIGFLSAAGSLCWFIAFSMTKLANVRTLGQTEFIFSVLISIFILHEKIKPLDVFGIAAVGVGTALILTG